MKGRKEGKGEGEGERWTSIVESPTDAVPAVPQKTFASVAYTFWSFSPETINSSSPCRETPRLCCVINRQGTCLGVMMPR